MRPNRRKCFSLKTNTKAEHRGNQETKESAARASRKHRTQKSAQWSKIQIKRACKRKEYRKTRDDPQRQPKKQKEKEAEVKRPRKRSTQQNKGCCASKKKNPTYRTKTEQNRKRNPRSTETQEEWFFPCENDRMNDRITDTS